MSDLVTEVRINRPVDDVAALLAAKPSTWLRGFLQLATHRHAAHTAAYIEQRPWYRLGPAREVQPGVISAPLIWWPHLEPDVFTTFRGEFRAIDAGPEAVVVLAGTTSGGQSQRDAAVLATLLQLIAAAVAADQSLGG